MMSNSVMIKRALQRRPFTDGPARARPVPTALRWPGGRHPPLTAPPHFSTAAGAPFTNGADTVHSVEAGYCGSDTSEAGWWATIPRGRSTTTSHWW